MNFDLDTTLIELVGNQSGKSYWKIRNAVEGVQIFGGIGSGKTSGSGRMIALKYLAAGFGGLVLTAKPDEKELWEEYARLTGRGDDLVIVEPGRGNYFNFLDYEIAKSIGNSVTENIVDVMKTVIRASSDKASGSSDDPFWETALDMLIVHVVDLCKLAYGKISVQLMYDIVQTLPRADAVSKDTKSAFAVAYEAARQRLINQSEEWEQGLSVEELQQMKADGSYEAAMYEAIPDVRLFNFIEQFFKDSFKNLSEKTRSIIEFSFSGFLFHLLRDPVYSLFCSRPSTFTPEDCLQGKIILLNLPVKLHHKAGRDIQIMFKYIWQRSMEKRNINDNGRPVFLWADEAQNFLHEHDADYQATARSSRIATVYISQNLPNYHANMGGAKADFKVKSFLGTLGTKIFHANADIETNRFASELIGDGFFIDVSKTSTQAGHFSASRTRAMKVDRVIRPEQFAQQKTGGPDNNFQVEGIMHIQGNALKDGANHVKVNFNQKYIPQLKINHV